MVENVLYFRISPKANLAITPEGQPTYAYTKIAFTSANYMPSDVTPEYTRRAIAAVAAFLGTRKSYIKSISESEYMNAVHPYVPTDAYNDGIYTDRSNPASWKINDGSNTGMKIAWTTQTSSTGTTVFVSQSIKIKL